MRCCGISGAADIVATSDRATVEFKLHDVESEVEESEVDFKTLAVYLRPLNLGKDPAEHLLRTFILTAEIFHVGIELSKQLARIGPSSFIQDAAKCRLCGIPVIPAEILHTELSVLGGQERGYSAAQSMLACSSQIFRECLNLW